MSRTRKFLDGVALGYSNQALIMLTGLWLTPFLLNRIGQDEYGVWLIGGQVILYLSLLDFGVVALLPRDTALASGEDQTEGTKSVARVVSRGVRMLTFQTPLVMLAAAGIWHWMPASWVNHQGPIGTILIAYAAMFPLRLFRAVLQGLQDLRFLGIIQTFTWLAGLVTTVLMVLGGYGLYSLVYGWIVAELSTCSVCFTRLWIRYRSSFPASLEKLQAKEFREYISRCFWVSINQIAQVFLGGTELLVIGKVLGPGPAVIYSCTTKLTSVLSNQPQLLMQAALPGLSEMRAGGRERIVDVALALGQGMLLLTGAVACVVIATNRSFVSWWVGSNQYGGLALSTAMALSMILRHFNTIQIYTLFSLGREKRLFVTNLIDGAAAAALSLLFVPRFGLGGAVIGSLLSVVFISLVANLYALGRELGMTTSQLLTPYRSWALKTLPVAALAFLLQKVSLPPLVYLPFATGVISLVYFGIHYSTVVEPPLGLYTRPRVQLALSKLRAAWA